MSNLSIKNICKSYGNIEVLKDISFDIEDGDFLVLVGPSGCGKSTLLNMMAGLESITSGDIIMGNKVVNDIHPSKRDIAMVFQSYALYPNMTVEKNLSFGLEMHKVPKIERKKRIDNVAKMLQITDYLQRKPAALSGGQRQRVAMGRALVRSPKIFLFDEPLSNLDAKLRVDMRTEIKLLHQKLGTTIVYVTHDQIEALTLSTKIAVMNNKIVQQLGTADEIYNNPKNVFVAQFMGSPPMNILNGRIKKIKSEFYFLTEKDDKEELIKLDTNTKNLEKYKDKKIILGVRPESIRVYNEEKDNSSFTATVDLVEPAGADCFVILSLLGNSFNARMNGNFRADTNAKIKLSFKKDSLHFFDNDTKENINQ